MDSLSRRSAFSLGLPKGSTDLVTLVLLTHGQT